MFYNCGLGSVLKDPLYPDDDPFIDHVPVNKLLLYGDRESQKLWAKEVYDFVKDGKITPSYFCQWLFENIQKGYGTHVTDGQDVIKVVTDEEHLRRLRLFLGNKYREPYCPQFDD